MPVISFTQLIYVKYRKKFIQCEDNDFLLKQNTNLVHIMKRKSLSFEFRVRDGGHTWEYWRSALDLALGFIGNSFRN